MRRDKEKDSYMGYEDHRPNKDCFRRGLNTKYHFACKIWFENEDYNLYIV